MRITSPGHVILAATMIALGILGLIDSNYAAVWRPVPIDVPAHKVLGYLCASLSLACGIGLLWKSVSALAARLLLAYLLLWSLLSNVPAIYRAHAAFGVWYGLTEAAVMVAAAWVMYARLTADGGPQRFAFASGDGGVRIASMFFGASLVYFGVGHFAFLNATVADVPVWLPWRVAWAYLTGATFIAAGLAILLGVFVRLAATLATLQIGLFLLLVWVPLVAAPNPSAFQWSETIITAALTAGALVVADSFRNMAWFDAKSTKAGAARG